MNSLVSVIVPVYNVEKYINRCLDSIVSQSYSNLEIILIDDGSKDSSGILCDDWASRDKRIKVIHKQNAGLGMARNSGLEVASGKYVIFIDSDDFIDHNMIKSMLSSMINNNSESCYCSYYTYSNDSQKVLDRYSFESRVISGKDLLLDILGSEPECSLDYNKSMSVWLVLYSRDIITKNNIMFYSEREYISEDLLFNTMYFSMIDKVSVMDECLYYYCINNMSLSHRYYSDRIEREKKIYFKVCEILGENLNKKDFLTRYNRLFLGRVRNCIMQEVLDSHINIIKRIHNIKKIANDEVVKNVLENYPYYKNPIKIRLFNMALKYRSAVCLYFFCLLKGRS